MPQTEDRDILLSGIKFNKSFQPKTSLPFVCFKLLKEARGYSKQGSDVQYLQLLNEQFYNVKKVVHGLYL